jgi:transposase-like protein
MTALNKRANEMYTVKVGKYDDEYIACVTEEYGQAVEVRDRFNARVEAGTAASDMTAEIDTIRAFRKGQKVPKNYV